MSIDFKIKVKEDYFCVKLERTFAKYVPNPVVIDSYTYLISRFKDSSNLNQMKYFFGNIFKLKYLLYSTFSSIKR